MPPEPLPFDRKDFFKERKPSSSDPAGVVSVRWRESPTTPSSHHNNHGSFSQRCNGAGGSSDFRRPFSGHGKQVGGGWHVTTLEPWQEKFIVTGHDSTRENNHNSWDEIPPKDQQDKNNGCVVGTTGSQRLDSESSLGSSLDWKPLKWSRSGSLSSRGVCVDMKIDAVAGNNNVTSLESPSEDGVPCLTPRTPGDDVSSRKKPRLGWGEGLAKYEKKKVGPDDNNGMVDRLEPSPSSQLDKSPSLTGCSDCASPATPSSFACSSSPGVEEKASVKVSEVDDNDTCTPSLPSSHQTEGGPTFNLENLELTEAVNMTSLLNELLQSDDTNRQSSGFVKSTAMDKLQLWKADISRTLEITETEIDSLENELKSLVSLPREECNDMNTEEKSLSIVSSIEKGDDSLQEEHTTGVEDSDRESPGTATSKFVEPITSSDENTPSSCILDIRSEETEAKSSEDDLSHLGFSTSSVVPNKYDKELAKQVEELSTVGKADANEADGKLSILLPNSQWSIDVPKITNDSLVKDNFGMKKRFLKFKERIITLKFRTFQYLWKEDLRLLSVRKFSTKSHKKMDLSSRSIGFNDYQKHRSSIRSRFSSPAGNLSLVPTTEITEYANKLLSDSRIKIYRDTLKTPPLILDKSERVNSKFITVNGLVENPVDAEKERCIASSWMSEEKDIFLEKFSLYGKDFRKIASFLNRKTVADCVEFYYKNHKSDLFQKTKKHPEFARQGKSKSNTNNMYLVTSGKRWSRESNVASLDILGAASAMAESQQQKSTPKFFIGTSRDHKRVNCEKSKSNSLSLFGNERETAAADVLAGICGSISSEALSSCITSLGYPKRQVSTHETAMQYDVDEETWSDDDSCGGEMNPADWTDDEKSRFLEAVRLYGKDFALISLYMSTRTRDQCNVYYSKARKCLGLDSIHVSIGNKGDVGVGPNEKGDSGSDDDDTACCMVDSGSVISCDKSSSEFKMDVEELHSSDSKQEEIVVKPNKVDERGVNCKLEELARTVDLEDTTQNPESSVRVEVDLSIVEQNNNGFFGRDPSHRKTLSQDDISSRLSFRKSGSQRSSSTDGYHLHLPKHSLMDCVESSQVLKGYPVTVTTNKSSMTTSFSTESQNLLPEHFLPRDYSLQMCTTTNASEKKPGDVKLFGQILTNRTSPQPHQKPNGRKSFNLKFDSHSGDEANNNNNNNGFGVEKLKNVPLRRSYGFWDGNRIQTGFPSLPDSSILLAKYPSAFEPHQQNRFVQPFTVDKLLLSEIPRRNHSSESLSTLQQAVVVGCNGVTDPVTAIRMHYAQTEQYNNGSNGDIGSR